MGIRLCFVFCFACAAVAALARGSVRQSLLRHADSTSWVDRANAAVYLAGEPETVPRLILLAQDDAKPVRQNALWALHESTGMPWATRFSQCADWWRVHGGKTLRDAAPETLPWRNGEWPAQPALSREEAQASLDMKISTDGVLTVALRTRFDPVWVSAVATERYGARLYRRGGGILRDLSEDPPATATLTVRIYDSTGQIVSVEWASLDYRSEAASPPPAAAPHTFDISFLPPGTYTIEAVLGSSEIVRRPPAPASSTPADIPLLLPDLRATMRFRC